MLRASRHPVPLLPWRRAPAPPRPLVPRRRSLSAGGNLGPAPTRPSSLPPPSLLLPSSPQTCSPCARPAGSAGMVRGARLEAGPPWTARLWGAETRASPPPGELPLQAQRPNSGARLSGSFVLLNGERTARGCALHSAPGEGAEEDTSVLQDEIPKPRCRALPLGLACTDEQMPLATRPQGTAHPSSGVHASPRPEPASRASVVKTQARLSP